MNPHSCINSEKRNLKAPLSYGDDKYVIFSLDCQKEGLNIVSGDTSSLFLFLELRRYNFYT